MPAPDPVAATARPAPSVPSVPTGLRLRRLLPDPTPSVDAGDDFAHPDGAAGAPFVRANMVSSLDGAAVHEGTVGALTGPVDFDLLILLRSLADVLLVGAGTVRAEGYGSVRTRPAFAAARDATGVRPHPHARLAVVSRSLDLDLASPAFVEAPVRPLVATTTAADPARVAAAGEVVEVLVAGDAAVDLPEVLAALGRLGLTRVLTEGGPSLLADLYAADLVDEQCLALSPTVVGGGTTSRITAGAALARPRRLELRAAHEAEGFLFLRHRRAE